MPANLLGPGPSTAALWLTWHLDIPAAAALIGTTLAYGAGVRALRRRGLDWPLGRTAAWLVGEALLALVTLGGPAAWGRTLLWMFTVRLVAFFLVAPPFLALGRPLELIRDVVPGSGAATRFIKAARAAAAAVGHPLIGPVIVPAVLGVIYFSPILTAALTNEAAADAVFVVVLVLGMGIALGLVGETVEVQTTLALLTALGLGLAELMLDAVPGIVVAFHNHLLVGAHWAGLQRAWPPSPHLDQTHAGAILWGVAEFADLPFLAVLTRRLIKADALEAARVDRERGWSQPRSTSAAQAVGSPTTTEVTSSDEMETPWWLSDPERMRGHLLRRPPTEDRSG